MEPGEECQTSLIIPYPASPPPVLLPNFPPMSMIWDAPLAASVAEELNTQLAGARLRGHRFDWENRELSLFFRSTALRWSLHPRDGFVTLHPPTEPPKDSRPLSAELVRVEARPDERVLRFGFRKVRGRSRSVQVVVELMTNQWNALMVEGPDEWIRHLLWTRRSEARTLVVGRPYVAPDPPGRRGLNKPLSLEEWEELMEGTDGEEARRAVLETVAFASPLNLPSLLKQQGEGNPSDPGGATGYSLWLQLKSLSSVQPCVLETSGGQQPYPIVLDGFNAIQHITILDAIKAVSEGGSRENDSSSRTLERLDRLLHKAKKRVRSLEREMANAADPEENRDAANLLMAHLREVEKGATQVTLKGFHGEGVTLSLDPSLSPHENAEALYEEAGRQERARKRLPPLVDRANARVEELAHLRERLSAGEISPEEVEALLPKKGRGDGGGVREKDVRLPYKRYRSSGGLEIRVGRGSGDNDALTFHHARPGDVWLHARDSSGAHVVLRWTENEAPPAKDLKEAAVLAALHSRARGSGVVPVDWTRKKYIRKPRKAPPGRVLPSRTQTIFIQPDPELPERLAWKED